jgi:hypothetical protein
MEAATAASKGAASDLKSRNWGKWVAEMRWLGEKREWEGRLAKDREERLNEISFDCNGETQLQSSVVLSILCFSRSV